MPTPRRYTNGISNVQGSSTLGDLGMPDPTLYHVFMDDFDFFDETDGVDWDIAATSGSIVMADGGNGTILLTTKAADDSLAQLATNYENFALVAGKKAWFKAKVTAGAATSQDMIIGLHSDDQTPVAGAPASGVYFRKDAGDTNWDFQIMNTSVSVAVDTAIATCTTSAVTLGWEFDGVSAFKIFVNDAMVGTVTTTDFPTTELGVAATVQAGSSSAATLTIDYLCAINER